MLKLVDKRVRNIFVTLISNASRSISKRRLFQIIVVFKSSLDRKSPTGFNFRPYPLSCLALYVKDLFLFLKETELKIYADDITVWPSRANCCEIQQTLNRSLRETNQKIKIWEQFSYLIFIYS